MKVLNLVILPAMWAAATATAQSLPSVPDRVTLQQAFAGRQEFLRSVHAVVEIPDDLKPTPGAFLRDEIKVLGPDRWYLDTSHGSFRHDWREDEVRNRTFIVGSDYRVHWPDGLGFEQTKHPAGSPPPIRLAAVPFFKATGWWPSNASLPCPVEFGGVLDLNVVVNDPEYELLPNVQSEHGERVWVLEKGGFDRIAFATSKGLALRSRVWSDPKSKRPVMRVLVRSWDPLAPEIWMPSNGRIETFVLKEAGEPPDKLVFDVTELRVNTLAPEHFEFTPPPGAFRYDRGSDSGYRQVVPGGFEHMGRRISELREYIASRADPGGTTGQTLARLGFWAAALVVLVIVLPAARRVVKGTGAAT